MFSFKRKNRLYLVVDNLESRINVPINSDLERQIRLINLTDRDLWIIHSLKPYVDQHISAIMGNFYDNLEVEPTLHKIINTNSSADKLKITLEQHISEIFQGMIDEKYMQKRLKIAHVHLMIGLDTKWYIGSFQTLLSSIIHLIRENIHNVDDVVDAIDSVTKIFNLEQQLVLEAYESESNRVKEENAQQKIQTQQLLDVQEKINRASENLAAISQEANASFSDLIVHAEEIVQLANEGSVFSLSAKTGAESGKKQLDLQNTNMKTITQSVDYISLDIQDLLRITDQMTHVVSIVTDIAEQTNLLSLNATIESANAGEAGKGFSVVAKEIRKLSIDTRRSVSDVSSLIASVNAQVEKVSARIENIREAVITGNENMIKTDAQFEEILNQINDSQLKNDKIEEELITLSTVVNELGPVFNEVTIEADRLTTIS